MQPAWCAALLMEGKIQLLKRLTSKKYLLVRAHIRYSSCETPLDNIVLTFYLLVMTVMSDFHPRSYPLMPLRCPQASPNLHVKHFLRASSWAPPSHVMSWIHVPPPPWLLLKMRTGTEWWGISTTGPNHHRDCLQCGHGEQQGQRWAENLCSRKSIRLSSWLCTATPLLYHFHVLPATATVVSTISRLPLWKGQ